MHGGFGFFFEFRFLRDFQVSSRCWWVVLVAVLGVSGCQIHSHHHNGRVGPSYVRAKPAKGGGEVLNHIVQRERKDKLGKLLLTKLLSPRHLVTLSQIPPSQKETWGQRACHVSMRVLTRTPTPPSWSVS